MRTTEPPDTENTERIKDLRDLRGSNSVVSIIERSA